MSTGAPEEAMSPKTLEAPPSSAPRLRVPAANAPSAAPAEAKLKVQGLNAWYGDKQSLFGIDLAVPAREVTAMIGPSGCGKSTLIRCLNRMHETVPGARLEGSITYEGHEILRPDVDPVAVRRRIGMVFQKPTPFPTLSIFDNVAAGLRLHGERDSRKISQVVEQSLRKAALWEEVKDVLNKPGGSLSGGQQQRLCIARGLAIETDVLLLDEPCSALDPISTAKIEELLFELKNSYTIVIVTHNMQQAARVSQKTLFMLSGKLIEFGETNQMFTAPTNKLTEDYITGRFG
jgi:phosphate transport system ATP-binding protein